MTDDIVKRLELEARRRNWDEAIPAMIEAEAEIRKLRERLRYWTETYRYSPVDDEPPVRAAKAALGESDE